MNHASRRPSVLALALVLAAGAAQAGPQAGRSLEERRAQQDPQLQGQDGRLSARKDKRQEAVGAQQDVAPKYPQAKRKEPEGRASAKRTPELKAMFDAFNAKDTATVLATADRLIADPEANAYEKSASARLAGASQLNTDNARAQAYLQKALEFDGLTNNEHFEAMYLVAQLQVQQQQYDQGLATVERFMSETGTRTPEALALKGNALYRLKRYPDAEAALKEAIGAGPDPRPEWIQLLIGTYADMGKPEEAGKLAERIGAAGAGDDAQSQLNLAATYMQAGQDDKAIAILEKLRAAGQLTGEQDYKNLVAMYANAGGREKDVIQVVNEGLDKGILKPDHGTYTALAQAYWFTDQSEPAIEAFKKAAPLAPNGETYLNLARALNNAGRAEEAKEAARQALAKGVSKPDDANRILGSK